MSIFAAFRIAIALLAVAVLTVGLLHARRARNRRLVWCHVFLGIGMVGMAFNDAAPLVGMPADHWANWLVFAIALASLGASTRYLRAA